MKKAVSALKLLTVWDWPYVWWMREGGQHTWPGSECTGVKLCPLLEWCVLLEKNPALISLIVLVS